MRRVLTPIHDAVMYTRDCHRTWTIGSTPTKTAASSLTTSSTPKIPFSSTSLSSGCGISSTNSSTSTRASAYGVARSRARVRKSSISLQKVLRCAIMPCPRNSRASLNTRPKDLEHLQCPQRLVFVGSEVEHKRESRRSTGGKVAR